MKSLSPRIIKSRIIRIFFILSFAYLSVLYGMLAYHFKLFPYYPAFRAVVGLYDLWPKDKSQLWYYARTQAKKAVTKIDKKKMAPGLTKMVTVDKDFGLSVKVIDDFGEVVHQWRIEWSDVWPETPDYLTDLETPHSRPGTHVHGAQILPNGDLVFNFEHLCMIRMSPCGKVIWRLKYRTHHSIFVDDNGNFWAPAERHHYEASKKYPLYEAGFIEPVILEVSPDGRILQERSLFDLLAQNNLDGALYSTSLIKAYPLIRGDKINIADTLHLNDVEIFTKDKTPGFFKPGDIMVSLRNINMILVFDPHWKLKYQMSDEFVRQHDPDFIDGNRISVYDNHNTLPLPQIVKSRILVKTVTTGASEVVFGGTAKQPFSSYIMGTHQWIDNGNLLVTESINGRALEITPQGEIVWELHNLVEPGWVGLMEEVERLPERYNKEFFANARSRCRNKADEKK